MVVSISTPRSAILLTDDVRPAVLAPFNVALRGALKPHPHTLESKTQSLAEENC